MRNDELKALEGYVKLYRCILYSDIWDKPAEYLKIFIYLLLKVNHKKHKLERGANIFNFADEFKNIPHVTKSQIYNFLRWAKSEDVNMITAHKTTRGVILKLNAYELWQDFDYTELQKACNTSATQIQHDIQEHENVINSSTLVDVDLKNKIVCGSHKNVVITFKQYESFINKITNDLELAKDLINQLSEKIEMGDSRYKPFNKDFPNAHYIALQKFYNQHQKIKSSHIPKTVNYSGGGTWKI